jgi:hypothetical protein
VSSRAVRASLQSQPVLYNAAGKKIKEQVLNQRFKVQGFNVASLTFKVRYGAGSNRSNGSSRSNRTRDSTLIGNLDSR